MALVRLSGKRVLPIPYTTGHEAGLPQLHQQGWGFLQQGLPLPPPKQTPHHSYPGHHTQHTLILEPSLSSHPSPVPCSLLPACILDLRHRWDHYQAGLAPPTGRKGGAFRLYSRAPYLSSMLSTQVCLRCSGFPSAMKDAAMPGTVAPTSHLALPVMSTGQVRKPRLRGAFPALGHTVTDSSNDIN